jgi:hypothetical protein
MRRTNDGAPVLANRLSALLEHLGITTAPRYRIKKVPRSGRVEFKAIAEIFFGSRVLCWHKGPAFRTSHSDDVAAAPIEVVAAAAHAAESVVAACVAPAGIVALVVGFVAVAPVVSFVVVAPVVGFVVVATVVGFVVAAPAAIFVVFAPIAVFAAAAPVEQFVAGLSGVHNIVVERSWTLIEGWSQQNLAKVGRAGNKDCSPRKLSVMGSIVENLLL